MAKRLALPGLALAPGSLARGRTAPLPLRRRPPPFLHPTRAASGVRVPARQPMRRLRCPGSEISISSKLDLAIWACQDSGRRRRMWSQSATGGSWPGGPSWLAESLPCSPALSARPRMNEASYQALCDPVRAHTTTAGAVGSLLLSVSPRAEADD
jgi:hypothetical protein